MREQTPWMDQLARASKRFERWRMTYRMPIEIVSDSICPDVESIHNQLLRRYLYEELHDALMYASPTETPWWPDHEERLSVFERYEVVMRCRGITALTRLKTALSSFRHLISSDIQHD